MLVRLLATLVLIPTAAAQDPPLPKPTDRFEVPSGCTVKLFAESPHFFNPTALDVDHRGRVWVTEAVNYRKWRKANKGRQHPKGDRIMILEDTDGDGVCDSSKVFVQEPDLVAPLGICVIGNRVLVSCSPHAILYTDTDGDDIPDQREIFLTGFGGHNHDHGLHSFVAGADGYLYFNTGNAGPHIVVDKAGWNLRVDRQRGLRSDDGRLWVGGLVMRIRPDGTGLRILAHNFRNPYEVATDAYGNMFQSDNDDDGNRGCRTGFVMERGNYGYYSADGKRSWRADKRPGQSTWTAHWHQDDPGVMPAGASNGAGGPTGVAVYEGPFLPGCPDGTVLNCDAGAGVVYGHIPKPQGAGFEFEQTVFMRVRKGTGGKRAKWFRPSDVAVGIDGSIFVADWYDPGVGGHAAGDRAAYGRILRVSGPAERDPAANRRTVDLTTDSGLAMALINPAANVRGLAFQRLRHRGAEGANAVIGLWQNSPKPRTRARALAWLAGTKTGTEFLRHGLRDRDPNIRVTAIRATRLHHNPADAFAMIRDLANDPSAAVRREVLLAMTEVAFADCQATLLTVAERLDPADRFMVEALGAAVGDRESQAYALLLARLGDQPLKWTPRFATIAWRLHPVESVPAHLARARSTLLPVDARTRSIDAIAFVDAKAAAIAMQQLATSGPADTRAIAAYWLKSLGAGAWRRHGVAQFVSDRADAALLWRSGLMRRGLKSFDVAVQPGRRLWLVVNDGDNGYGCDWADWINPQFTGGERKVALTSMAWTRATTGWGQVRIDRNAAGGKLSVNGRQALKGIGTHAPSEITYQIPAGVERLRGRAGPDHGGVSQNGDTLLEFLIYLQKPPKTDHLLAWRKTLLDADRPLAERKRIASMMARDRDGGRTLLGLIAQGKLPAVLRPTIAAAIFKNPDRSVRLQASKHFPIPGTEALKLPPIDEIAALVGVPARGKAHFTRVCATCHVFGKAGKDIGPNLTQIHKKYGRAALLESILNPDAGISFGYENWIIEKKNGEFILGFILAEGETLVVKDQEGKRHVIPAADIESKQKSPTSLMPAALVTGMSAQDLADLLTFLLTH